MHFVQRLVLRKYQPIGSLDGFRQGMDLCQTLVRPEIFGNFARYGVVPYFEFSLSGALHCTAILARWLTKTDGMSSTWRQHHND